MSIVRYFKNRIIKKKLIKAEIDCYIKKEDYYYAGILAENSSFKELEKLANEYYKTAINKLKENIFLKNLKEKENYIPSKGCHIDLIKKMYLIPQDWIDNNILESFYPVRYNTLEKQIINN